MASTEIDYETAAPKKSGIAKFCSDVGRFIWNSDTGEFIGRTGKSWGECFFRTLAVVKETLRKNLQKIIRPRTRLIGFSKAALTLA